MTLGLEKIPVTAQIKRKQDGKVKEREESSEIGCIAWVGGYFSTGDS